MDSAFKPFATGFESAIENMEFENGFTNTDLDKFFDPYDLEEQDDLEMNEWTKPTSSATPGIAIPGGSLLEPEPIKSAVPDQTSNAGIAIPEGLVLEPEPITPAVPDQTSNVTKLYEDVQDLPPTPPESIPEESNPDPLPVISTNAPPKPLAETAWMKKAGIQFGTIYTPEPEPAPPSMPVSIPLKAPKDSKLSANFVKIVTGIPYTALMAVLKPQSKVAASRHVIRVLSSFRPGGVSPRDSIPAAFRGGMDGLFGKITSDDVILKYVVTWFIEKLLPSLEEEGAADITTKKQIAEFDSEYQGLKDLESAKAMILREFNNHIQLVGALESQLNTARTKNDDQTREIESLKTQMNAANARFDLLNEKTRTMQIKLDDKKAQLKNQQDLIDRLRLENNGQSERFENYKDSYRTVYADYKDAPEGQQTTHHQVQDDHYQDPQSDPNSVFPKQQQTANQNQQVQDGYYQDYNQSHTNPVFPQQQPQYGYHQVATPEAYAQFPITPPRSKKRKAEVLETDWYICHMETKPGNNIICGGLNEKMIKKGTQWAARSKCKHCGRNTWAQFKEWVSPEYMMNMNQGAFYEIQSPELSGYLQSPPAAIPEQPLPVHQNVTNLDHMIEHFPVLEVPSAAPAKSKVPASKYKPNPMIRTAPQGSMMMPAHPQGSL